MDGLEAKLDVDKAMTLREWVDFTLSLRPGPKIGFPFDIPNMSRAELPTFFTELGFKVGAEIGVWKGHFSKALCRAGLEVYAIDPWLGFTGQGRDQRKQEVQDLYYEAAKHSLSRFPKCHIIRKTSMDAVKDFKPNSLDFVYIDGNHEFPFVAQDIYEWSKIVRPGGIVAGHDYFNTQLLANNVLCHVKAVVDAYTRLYEIDRWWVFDKPQSWMWFKK